MMRSLRHGLALTVLTILVVGGGHVSGSEKPEPQEPRLAPASDEGEQALRSFQYDPTLAGNLFAAEPMVANPVALFVDDRGRVFVCETFRQGIGVTDNRKHDEAWLNDDLAAQTVEDRREFFLKHLGDQALTYMQHDDRIRLLLDEDDDGRADQSHVFAAGFNDLVDGTGAGVLEYQGKVYYTNIPHLWLLRDEDGNKEAEVRESLHYGYGVRVAFRGHDSHGLCLGPDGRLYFSIGDRGYHIETPDGKLVDPASGAVFRCDLDGSNLEVFATGLRNPQELAFDEFGNLFTGDNNSDSGDKARWVYVVENSDSGWRMYYQYLGDRGPFNREKIWHPYHSETPAYIVPPVANIADGPSGLDYYPGTGFAEDFRGRFFLCDFRGTPSMSGIRSFRVEPDGAFFRLTDEAQPIWNMLATDLQFGPDGALYVSDWVFGWTGEGKGRLYRFVSKDAGREGIVREVRQLLAQDFAETTADKLRSHLFHADRRVRQKAQFELARRGDRTTLSAAALEGDGLLGRLHGIWGLGQVARSNPREQPTVHTTLRQLLGDPEDEVRSHAAKLLGEGGDSKAGDALVTLLSDAQPRVRYFATVALSKLPHRQAVPEILNLIAENQNRDPILRHGGIQALSRLASVDQLKSITKHSSSAVRLAAVVALRNRRSAEVAGYLRDSDPAVVLEAARAIHDLPIDEALPELAGMSPPDEQPA